MSIDTAVTSVKAQTRKARATSVEPSPPVAVLTAPAPQRGRPPSVSKNGVPLSEARAQAQQRVTEAKMNLKVAKNIHKKATKDLEFTAKKWRSAVTSLENAEKRAAANDSHALKGAILDAKKVLKQAEAANKVVENEYRSSERKFEKAQTAYDNAITAQQTAVSRKA